MKKIISISLTTLLIIFELLLLYIVIMVTRSYIWFFNDMKDWDTLNLSTVIFHFILIIMILYEVFLTWSKKCSTKFVLISFIILEFITGLFNISPVAFWTLTLIVNAIILVLILVNHYLKTDLHKQQ